MSNEFNFEIISIDGKKLAFKVSEVNCKTTGGDIGILKDHNPLVGILETSILEVIKENKSMKIVISGGVINVNKDIVSVLVDSFYTKDELDLKEISLNKKELENQIELLKNKNDNLSLQVINKKYLLELTKERLLK